MNVLKGLVLIPVIAAALWVPQRWHRVCLCPPVVIGAQVHHHFGSGHHMCLSCPELPS